MRTPAGARSPAEGKEAPSNPKPVATIRADTPGEVQATFTLTFTLGTPMREITDAVIRTALQYSRGNRLRAAQLLQINPRTIRRCLGKKEAAGSTYLAA